MSKAFILLPIIFNVALIHVALQFCYKTHFLDCRSTDTENYRLSIKINDNNTITAVTVVKKEIAFPVWNFMLIQHNDDQKIQKVRYNGSVRTCDFWNLVRRIRVFRGVSSMLMLAKYGNLSLKCPLKVGTYAVNYIYVPPDAKILKYMYVQNAKYTLHGSVWKNNTNRLEDRVCTMEVNMTIERSC